MIAQTLIIDGHGNAIGQLAREEGARKLIVSWRDRAATPRGRGTSPASGRLLCHAHTRSRRWPKRAAKGRSVGSWRTSTHGTIHRFACSSELGCAAVCAALGPRRRPLHRRMPRLRIRRYSSNIGCRGRSGMTDAYRSLRYAAIPADISRHRSISIHGWRSSFGATLGAGRGSSVCVATSRVPHSDPATHALDSASR